MRKALQLIMFFALLLLMAVPVSAGTIAWDQQFNEQGVGSFKSLEVFMTEGSTGFAGDGFSGFSSSGWSGTSFGDYALATGTAVSNLNFNLLFDAAQNKEFTFAFLAWADKPLKDNPLEVALVGWEDGGWNIRSLNSDGREFNRGAAPVPEPGTVMLLSSGLVGLIGIGRKKFNGLAV